MCALSARVRVRAGTRARGVPAAEGRRAYLLLLSNIRKKCTFFEAYDWLSAIAVHQSKTVNKIPRKFPKKFPTPGSLKVSGSLRASVNRRLRDSEPLAFKKARSEPLLSRYIWSLWLVHRLSSVSRYIWSLWLVRR